MLTLWPAGVDLDLSDIEAGAQTLPMPRPHLEASLLGLGFLLKMITGLSYWAY